MSALGGHDLDSEDEVLEHLIKDFSLEMTGKDIAALHEARAVIPQDARINVTYLASEDLDMRVAAAKAVHDLGFVPVPHISARRLGSQNELEDFLERLREVNAAHHVFVIGGDPTAPAGPYPDALSVIGTGLLEKYGVREVGIAGYPEGHPDIATDVLWRDLEGKTAELRRRGLSAVVLTQFAFDTAPVIDWIRDARTRGIDAQLRIGVPGPAGVKQLLSFARRFGIGANAMIVKKYGFSLTNLLGTAGPDRFLNDLAGVLSDESLSRDVKLHFYAFGGLTPTAQWAQRFIDQRSVK